MDRFTVEEHRAFEISDMHDEIRELADKTVTLKDLNSRMDALENKMKEHGHVLTAFQILLVKENDRLREENDALKKSNKGV